MNKINMYNKIKLFLLLIIFNISANSQNYLENYNCTETNLFKIYDDGFSYEKNLIKNYNFNLTDSHIIFIDGSHLYKDVKTDLKFSIDYDFRENTTYLKFIYLSGGPIFVSIIFPPLSSI